MKLNKILMALAATAMVGCTSDDLNEFSSKQAVEDSRLIELDQNFALAGVGVEGVATRTHWTGDLKNEFLPIYAKDASSSKLSEVADLTAQAVGLCWLGQTPGTDVYTNYQFYHFGWLNKGEAKAKIECNKLTNGAKYDEITVSSGSANAEAKATDWGAAGLPDKAKKDGADNLNYNSGVYKTDNKSIFGGQYIVYYPFNEDFKEAGTIPAAAKTNWDKVPTAFTSPEIGKETFRYSAPVTIKGGDQAADFGLYNLSSLVQLRVAAAKGYTGSTKFDQIVLYSAKAQLLKQANLAADKIVAGKKGVEIYAETEGTKTIVANFETAQNLTATDGSVTSAYITVLPTTVEDLVVLVHGTVGGKGKWAKVSKPNTVFEDGGARRLDITVADADFKTDFIAVDDASLKKALDEARAVPASATAPQKITVIGDIAINTAKDINDSKDAFITITGDALIVPEDVTLTLNTNLESDLRVLGKSCCSGAKGGRVVVQGGKLSNVTMEPTAVEEVGDKYDDYNPEVKYESDAATIAAGKTFDVKAGNVIVKAPVAHKGNIQIAEDAKVTVSETGDLNFMGSKVVNDGTIEVMKAGKFDITDKDGNASATDGKNMTNNGKFIHNVDAAVGTAVQLMNQNGEYRCRVDKQIKLDDAYQKWLACSVIEIVGKGKEYFNLGVAEKNINYQHKHKGVLKYIDIEVNTDDVTYFSNPAADGEGNGDDKNIQVGKLTVMRGGLYVPYATKKGKRELTVNGDMTVSAKTSLYSSKKITVKENLIVNNGAELKYSGKKQNEGGLAVEKDIKVSGAKFNAFIDKVDALDITCANFTLADGATAEFGNRTEGDTKNLTVSGTITNPLGCTFDIKAANQVAGSVLATITCTKLMVGGAFPGGKPQVVAE